MLIIPVPWMISNARKIVVLGRDLTEEGLMLNINFYLVEPGLASAVWFLNFDLLKD